MARVETEAGKPIPYDRVFALARPTAPIDRTDPKWAKKGLFAMLMLDEGLAQVATELDVDTMWLTARRAGRQVAAGCLTDPADREALERFFWTLLPSFKDSPALIRSRHGHFMDKPDNVISLINLATLRNLEGRWGVTLDPLRFRANIYIDGAKAWEEVDWVGSDITIGGHAFLVDRVNGRCGATNVNPATGNRDLDIPSSLRTAFGHKNLGVYLIARQNGAIAVGDTVVAPWTGDDKSPGNSVVSPQLSGTRRQFMCRGCYYIYDESAGLPPAGHSARHCVRRRAARLALPRLRQRKAALRAASALVTKMLEFVIRHVLRVKRPQCRLQPGWRRERNPPHTEDDRIDLILQCLHSTAGRFHSNGRHGRRATRPQSDAEGTAAVGLWACKKTRVPRSAVHDENISRTSQDRFGAARVVLVAELR